MLMISLPSGTTCEQIIGGRLKNQLMVHQSRERKSCPVDHHSITEELQQSGIFRSNLNLNVNLLLFVEFIVFSF